MSQVGVKEKENFIREWIQLQKQWGPFTSMLKNVNERSIQNVEQIPSPFTSK